MLRRTSRTRTNSASVDHPLFTNSNRKSLSVRVSGTGPTPGAICSTVRLTMSEMTFGLISETTSDSERLKLILKALRRRVRIMLKNWFLTWPPDRPGSSVAMCFHRLRWMECRARSRLFSSTLQLRSSLEFSR